MLQLGVIELLSIELGPLRDIGGLSILRLHEFQSDCTFNLPRSASTLT